MSWKIYLIFPIAGIVIGLLVALIFPLLNLEYNQSSVIIIGAVIGVVILSILRATRMRENPV